MPNSNPPCQPPDSNTSCDPGEVSSLIQQYPFLCVDGPFYDELGPVAGPAEFFGATENWLTALGSGTWYIKCKNNEWVLSWIVADLQDTGEIYADSGTFPNLVFGSFSSTGGRCSEP